MERGLLQREVAQEIGVTLWTVINWERQRTLPGARYVPAVVRFLGYEAFPQERSLAGRLRAARLHLRPAPKT
jgi:transcriptional regulator with XRE-family HTH domain